MSKHKFESVVITKYVYINKGSHTFNHNLLIINLRKSLEIIKNRHIRFINFWPDIKIISNIFRPKSLKIETKFPDSTQKLYMIENK